MNKWDKVSNWILGIPRPASATMSEWRKWNTLAKTERPVRYWLSENVLDAVQDVVTWPGRKLRDANIERTVAGLQGYLASIKKTETKAAA